MNGSHDFIAATAHEGEDADDLDRQQRHEPRNLRPTHDPSMAVPASARERRCCCLRTAVACLVMKPAKAVAFGVLATLLPAAAVLMIAWGHGATRTIGIALLAFIVCSHFALTIFTAVRKSRNRSQRPE